MNSMSWVKFIIPDKRNEKVFKIFFVLKRVRIDYFQAKRLFCSIIKQFKDLMSGYKSQAI